MNQHRIRPSTNGIRRKLLKQGFLGATLAISLPEKWTRPVLNSVLLPVHAQTSVSPTSSPTPCQNGVSRWLLSNYVENGVAYIQGSPQSTVEITINGADLTMVTDWFIINSLTNVETRGRIVDTGVIDLTTGEVMTTVSVIVGASPTHGGPLNIDNIPPLIFNLGCNGTSSVIVNDTRGLLSFELTQVI